MGNVGGQIQNPLGREHNLALELGIGAVALLRLTVGGVVVGHLVVQATRD